VLEVVTAAALLLKEPSGGKWPAYQKMLSSASFVKRLQELDPQAIDETTLKKVLEITSNSSFNLETMAPRSLVTFVATYSQT
jgi:hypothetical protein